MPSSASQPSDLPPLLVVCGPTATGKTSLALRLAEALGNAEIISADSRQVYRGMDIGTAKVGSVERARVVHHGLDLVAPDEPFSAADYLAHARAALAAIARRGRVALLVGGTGLYLRAVARGLALADTGHDAAVRADLEARLERDGVAALAVELQHRAPAVAARTDLANPRRVVRALERVALHGDQPPPPPAGYGAASAWIGLDLPAAVSDQWIGERARSQFAAGLVDEAAELRATYGDSPRAFSAFGYHEAFAVLDGRLSLEDAIARDAARTRHFARRQRTWFRAEPGVTWFDPRDDPLPGALSVARMLAP